MHRHLKNYVVNYLPRISLPVTAWSLYSIKSLSLAHFSRHCAFLGSIRQRAHRTLQSFYFSSLSHGGDHLPSRYSKRAGGFDSAQGHVHSPFSWSHLCLPGWGLSAPGARAGLFPQLFSAIRGPSRCRNFSREVGHTLNLESAMLRPPGEGSC